MKPQHVGRYRFKVMFYHKAKFVTISGYFHVTLGKVVVKRKTYRDEK